VTDAESPLVSAGMRARRGIWTEWSPYCAEIALSDIRRWAMAVYWPERPPRIYWDEDYARATRRGGIVAPVEFNPFAWSLPSVSRGATTRAGAESSDVVGSRRVNGRCRMRFGVRMRPGDRVRRRSCLDGWTVKKGRTGELLLVDFVHEWRNDRDEPVRDATFTLIYV
jgi:hypothetical protein